MLKEKIKKKLSELSLKKSFNKKEPFSVVSISLIDPGHEIVYDYRKIEDLLKRTCMSILQQRYNNLKIIVVGTKVPYWLETKQDKIIFVNAKNCEILDGRLERRQDRAIKRIISFLASKSIQKVDLFYTVDADDFLHIDLFNTIDQLNISNNNVDGFIWTKGLNVELIHFTDNTFGIGRTFLIDNFNNSCGTCRVIKGYRLDALCSEYVPSWYILQNGMNEEIKASTLPVANLSSNYCNLLKNIFKKDILVDGTFIHTLGRHIRQEEYFNFSYVPILGAAKSCGHGQHIGPRKGALHSDKFLMEVNRNAFLVSYGLKTFNNNEQLLNIWQK
jgi:hypothetical protein